MADCCVLFVNKEQTVASVVLGGLLKFWPVLSPTKQTLFLREMLNVIGALVEHTNGFNYDQYKDVLVKWTIERKKKNQKKKKLAIISQKSLGVVLVHVDEWWHRDLWDI